MKYILNLKSSVALFYKLVLIVVFFPIGYKAMADGRYMIGDIAEVSFIPDYIMNNSAYTASDVDEDWQCRIVVKGEVGADVAELFKNVIKEKKQPQDLHGNFRWRIKVIYKSGKNEAMYIDQVNALFIWNNMTYEAPRQLIQFLENYQNAFNFIKKKSVAN